MGEPAGIGGEVLAAWRRRHAGDPVLFAVDDPGRLRRVAALAGIGAGVAVIDDPSGAGRRRRLGAPGAAALARGALPPRPA
jgi:hypothetical protein